MKVNVMLGTMINARNIVSIAEKLPYDVDLCSGRYTVNAKSMLGVLSLPELKLCEFHVHTEDESECERVKKKLIEFGLLTNTGLSRNRSLYDITAFGEILIDFTCQGKNADGQTLFAQNPGGAPANVLVSASQLGAHTAFLGKAGKDMHGEFLKNVLEQKGVNTQGLLLDQEYFTTLAFVNLTEQGERTFSFARKPGADTNMHKQEINVEILDHTNIFHVGSLSLTDEPSRGTTFYAVKRAKEKGSIISYDPNYRASLWESEEVAKKHMRSLIPYVDVMKLSDEETELLTDEKEVVRATAKLFNQGVKVIVVTLGQEGAYVYSKQGGSKVAGFPSQVVDTNGAGDSFWGGFLYQLNASGNRPEMATKEELIEYVRYGNAVASLCVEGKGAIPSMPSAKKVEERLERD